MSAIDHNVVDAGTPKVAGLSPVARRAAISSALGSALEWIDFTAYGAVAATVLPAQFFPTMDPSSAILASFATFGVGFFARPAGGVVLGILGDKLGRKKVLLFTLVLMGVASFLIGCLPTYTSIGLWAPGLLVLFRFMQGFALGGEATGAQLLTMEHAPADQRGLFGSFINIGAPASQVLANLLLFLITASMTTEQFMSFGWRIPFLMSLLLVALGVYIRLKVEETPAFEHMKAHETSDKTGATRRASPLSVLRTHGGTVLRLMLFWAAPSACFYVVTVFSLGYVTKTIGVSNQTAFLCLLGANLVAVFTTVIGGAASDRFGRKPPSIIASLIMLAIALMYFPLLSTGNAFLIFLAMSIFVGSIQAQSGILPAFFAEPFPTSVRYTGSALAYTGANLAFSGPTPFVAAWLMQSSGGQVWVLTAMCVLIIVMSLVALVASPETRNFALDRDE
jgi:Sugar phosphate permease